MTKETDARQKGTLRARNRFRPGRGHPKWVDEAQLLDELRSRLWGSWNVVGEQIVRRGSYRYVQCKCEMTGQKSLIAVDNLRSGKTTGPRGSKAPSENRRVLGERYDAMKQRTRNSRSPFFADYGGRGIELRFQSRKHFIDWVLREFPRESYRGLQIDRIDNNGHYEPGNLRLVPQRENLRNTRRNQYVSYQGAQVVRQDLWHLIKTDHPDFQFSISWTVKLLRSGVPVDEVIKRGLEPERILTRLYRLRANPRIVARYRDG